MKKNKEPLNAEMFTSTAKNMSEIKTLAGNIMISLQVQDITAQQIASVNYLIESVHEKISTLLDQLDSDRLPEVDVHTASFKKNTFDPNAVYTKAGSRQHIVDEVESKLANPGEQQDDTDVASQDDINKLFN